MTTPNTDSQEYPPDFSEAYNKCLWRFAINAAPQIYDICTKYHAAASKLLDLCCGPGQLCLYFLEQGFSVTGIDLSKRMLELAAHNAKMYQEKSNWTLSNISHFDLNESFDIITSTFSSLNLLQNLDELKSAIRCAYSHLEEGGLFIFDLTTRTGASSHNNNFFRDTDEYTIIVNGFYNQQNPDKAFLHFLGFFKNEENLYQRFEHHQIETIFDLNDVVTILQDTGFRDIEYFVYGATTVQLVQIPELFPNIIIKATKRF